MIKVSHQATISCVDEYSRYCWVELLYTKEGEGSGASLPALEKRVKSPYRGNFDCGPIPSSRGTHSCARRSTPSTATVALSSAVTSWASKGVAPSPTTPANVAEVSKFTTRTIDDAQNTRLAHPASVFSRTAADTMEAPMGHSLCARTVPHARLWRCILRECVALESRLPLQST